MREMRITVGEMKKFLEDRCDDDGVILITENQIIFPVRESIEEFSTIDTIIPEPTPSLQSLIDF